MALDLRALERKIAKLQQLKELASDPEMLELLGELMTSNTDGGDANGGAAQPAPLNDDVPAAEQATTHPQHPQLELTGNGNGSRRGALKRSVWQFIPNAEASPATARMIADTMQAAGFEFRAKDPKLAVLEVVKNLHAEHLVEKCGETKDGSFLWRKRAA